MSRYRLVHLLLLAGAVVSLSFKPSDANATSAARSLFARLAALSSEPQLKIAFGQQRANEQGVGWSDLSGAVNRSDILTDTGDWPAVFGFNFASMTDTNASTPRVLEATLAAAKRAAAAGGIIAAHFPTNNPLGCSHDPQYKNCQKDPTGQPMRNLVAGRAGNAQWTAWLDLVADVCEGVAPAPVLFRPFHEMCKCKTFAPAQAAAAAAAAAAMRVTTVPTVLFVTTNLTTRLSLL
jgi:hypothetical protein